MNVSCRFLKCGSPHVLSRAQGVNLEGILIEIP
jgi:hypothetical protein